VSHGLEAEAEQLQATLAPELLAALPDVSNQTLLFPPPPIQHELNWPLLEFKESFFDLQEIVEVPEEERKGLGADLDDGEGGAEGWGPDEAAAEKDAATSRGAAAAAAAVVGGGWSADLDLDIGIDTGAAAEEDTTGDTSSAADSLVMPLSGKTSALKWGNNSALAADLCAAGAFDTAMHALQRQIGAVNFEPLKAGMLLIYSSSHCQLPFLPGSSNPIPLQVCCML